MRKVKSYLTIFLICFTQMNGADSIVLRRTASEIKSPELVIPSKSFVNLIETDRNTIFTKNEVYFCDDNFNILTKRQLSRDPIINPSKNGKYFLITENPKNSPENIYTITLLDNNGVEYNVEEVIYSENVTTNTIYDVSDYDGSIVKYTSSKARLQIYSKYNVLIREMVLFDENQDYPSYALMDISTNGKIIALLLNESNPSRGSIPLSAKERRLEVKKEFDKTQQISGNPHLFVIDIGGKVLFSKNFSEHESIGNLKINNNGELILCGIVEYDEKRFSPGGEITYCFNIKGKMLFKKDIYYAKVLFTDDSILLGNKYEVSLIDYIGNKYWSNTSFDTSPRSFSLVSGDPPIYSIIIQKSDGSLNMHIFNQDGNDILLMEYQVPSINILRNNGKIYNWQNFIVHNKVIYKLQSVRN